MERLRRLASSPATRSPPPRSGALVQAWGSPAVHAAPLCSRACGSLLNAVRHASPAGAERVMIASTSPALKGNATLSTTADDARRVAVAFVGQVPVKTRGTAGVGDLIVPSGKNDGTARAVSPEDYRRAEHGPIAGQAWARKTSEEVGEVTVAVGLGRSGAVAERFQDQKKRIDRLEKRLAALESRVSGSTPAVAGLSGPWLLLVLFALGGGLGAGLLWRRR